MLSFGLLPLVGLTTVAFDTSVPKVAVLTGAMLNGQTDMAIDNVIGSNIFNVLFILGLSALISPLIVNVHLISAVLIGLVVPRMIKGWPACLIFFMRLHAPTKAFPLGIGSFLLAAIQGRSRCLCLCSSLLRYRPT